MATRKLVIVKDRGYIPELKATGPIRTPARIPIETIRKLLVNGRTVYECDPASPADENKRTKLTLQAITEPTPAESEAPVAPENPEPEAPAAPEGDVEPPAEPENGENAEPEGDPEASEETDDDTDEDSDEADSVPNPDDVEPEDNTDSVAQNSGKKKNKKRR